MTVLSTCNDALAEAVIFPKLTVLMSVVGGQAMRKNPQHTGGAFFIRRLSVSGVQSQHCFVWGCLPLERMEKYIGFAKEKALRLAERPNDISSWESRNVEKQQLGGAVRFDDQGTDIILSCSGFEEDEDEELVVDMAHALDLFAMDLHGNELVRRIMAVSNNARLAGFAR